MKKKIQTTTNPITPPPSPSPKNRYLQSNKCFFVTREIIQKKKQKLSNVFVVCNQRCKADFCSKIIPDVGGKKSLQPLPFSVVITPGVHILILPLSRVSRVQNMSHASPSRRRRRVIPHRQVLILPIGRVPGPVVKRVGGRWVSIGKWGRWGSGWTGMRLGRGLQRIVRKGIPEMLALGGWWEPAG